MDHLTQGGLVSLVVTGVASSIIKYSFDQKLELYKSEAGRSNQEAIERIRDGLATNQKAQDARRGYEYEPRKRLYEQCEPLLFQLLELSGNSPTSRRRGAREAAKPCRCGRRARDGCARADPPALAEITKAFAQ